MKNFQYIHINVKVRLGCHMDVVITYWGTSPIIYLFR